MRHVVNVSGGLASWGVADIVLTWQPRSSVTLLFTDTCMEDQDLYRFLDDIEADWKHPIIRLSDGRTPWDVFFDERFLGNSRIDPCSKILKREMSDRWLRDNCDPQKTIIYLGFDASEPDRHERAKAAFAQKGWTIKSPLLDLGVLRPALVSVLQARGIKLPRLYDMGFEHNNCGGFCVKAGQRQFAHLLRTLPDRYAEHEANEQALRAHLDKDISVLRDRRGGKSRPITLREFRERVQAGEREDWTDGGAGACACFTASTDLDEGVFG